MKNKQTTRKRAGALQRKKIPRVLISRDFSAIEDDADAFRIIRKLAVNAGQNAAAEAKALGLARVYVRDNKLVKISAKGRATGVSPKIRRASFYIRYKPSTVLHAVR